MNKAELINEVTKVVCVKKEAAAAVDAVFGAIEKALKKGGKVAIAGFGVSPWQNGPRARPATPRPATSSK